MIWTPDDSPGWQPSTLTDAEETWLARRLAEQASTDRPSRSARGRMQKAVDRWSTEASWVALGLTSATATLPPPSRTTGKVGRQTGPSDPTGAVIDATWQEVSSAAWRWAHLTGPCPLDGTRDELDRLHECPDAGTAIDVADLAYLHLDPDDIIDQLMGTPPSSSAAWTAACHQAATWHTQAAAQTMQAYVELDRAGAEPPHLERIVAAATQLASKMAGLAGALAGWSGRSERPCAANCGGAAPEGRATCGRCRTAHWRARQAAS